MKIIELISTFYPIGGGQIFVRDLINALRTKHELLVVSLYSEKENFIVKELVKNDVKIVFLNKEKGIDYACSRKLKKVVKDFAPDIIHAHLNTYLTLFLSGVAKKHLTFYTFHSIQNKENSANRFHDYLIKYLVKRKLLHPVAISDIVASSLEQYYGFSNIPIIYNGVNLEHFKFGNPINERDIDFICVGSFTKIKNQLFIIKSFEKVLINNPTTNLYFLGEGPLEADCKNYALNNERLRERITFCGLTSDTFAFLKRAKFIVLCSEYEGNPIVINEAIASGVYIISNNVGGIPDVVDNESIGILFSKDNQTIEKVSQIFESSLKKYCELFYILKRNYPINSAKVDINTTAKNYSDLFMNEIASKKA